MNPSALRRLTHSHRAYSTSTPASASASASASTAAARLLESFRNKTLTQHQILDATQLRKLSLTLNRPTMQHQDMLTPAPSPGTPVPPGHHLICFTAASPESALGPDGTDTVFNAGPPSRDARDAVSEHTRLLSAVARRSASTGREMVLVEVERQLEGPRGAAVTDRRSWIFRTGIDAHAAGTSPRPRPQQTQTRTSRPTTITDIPGRKGTRGPAPTRTPADSLRRGSSRAVEGHAGLVVHGPLNLISILDYWGDVHGAGGASPGSVAYRAVAPLYAGDTCTIRTGAVADTACDIVAEKDGAACMTARVVGASRGR
ncbi:uncharacterized protein MAM_06903 [Metarhizium album ARSEF 1941]|uniref:Thioesterase family protein n=1 Tax=Metarhizium album (strain ARSEF 1941) TaxID=1081103 RepID=A0A0B2WNX6_METAS|nr:uncharacterized protein MAM_06903 [Metarhizium album ARSEF 1941]KHN95192.1 hypothetical protein MAM_06903 [Metarhizium album ARSEF 1941]